MSLIIELNAFANMFYLLEHLLLLNLVIIKLKCNNLIFNEIIVLNASFVCLLHSRFIEDHPIWILEDGPLISEVVLSQPDSASPRRPAWHESLCSQTTDISQPHRHPLFLAGSAAHSASKNHHS
jgi:hypothetical protein